VQTVLLRPSARGVSGVTPDAFQAALECGDIEAASEMLAENVVFRSAAVFEPYEGKPATVVLLTAVSRVLRDFRFVRSFIEEDGRGMALVFEAKIGSRPVEGIDILRLDAHGLVDDFRVMVRPHAALEALMEEMVHMVERVLADQGTVVE
jgi:SnoaL-like domain